MSKKQTETAKKKWSCRKCGGSRIERAYWADPNTQKLISCVGDHEESECGHTWCHDCNDHTELQLEGEENPRLVPWMELQPACEGMSYDEFCDEDSRLEASENLPLGPGA